MQTDDQGRAPMNVDRVAWLEGVAMAARQVLDHPGDPERLAMLAEALHGLEASEAAERASRATE